MRGHPLGGVELTKKAPVALYWGLKPGGMANLVFVFQHHFKFGSHIIPELYICLHKPGLIVGSEYLSDKQDNWIAYAEADPSPE